METIYISMMFKTIKSVWYGDAIENEFYNKMEFPSKE
jgi:hypothetical protein